MANPVNETHPTFSRITETGATSSWRAALPAVVVLAALVALIGYLASALSSYSQRAMRAERDAQQNREQAQGLADQIGTLQKDLAIAKSPGRTTVVLQTSERKAKNGPWAAATWGELAGDKSWMRVNAYGLDTRLENGQQFHAWFVPLSGSPVDLGAVDVDANGSGYTSSSALPGVDQGKTLELTQDDASAKGPGKVLAQVALPKLEPTMKEVPPAQDLPGAPQARTSGATQQMHKAEPGQLPGK